MDRTEKQQVIIYFISRALSALFDEVWMVGIPFYFAMKGYDIKLLAISSSLLGLGEFAGLVSVPFLINRYGARNIALGSDVVAAGLMGTFFILIKLDLLSAKALALSSFGVAALFGVWFASSEVTLSGRLGKTSTESFQRFVVFSNYVGPVLGPAIAGIAFVGLGLAGLALLNCFSFLFQLSGFARLTKQLDPTHQQTQSSYWQSISQGFQSIKKSPVVGRIIASSFFLKLQLMMSPFIAFKLKSTGMDSFSIGLAMSALGVGVLLSTLTYKNVGKENLAIAYKFSATFMIAFGFFTLFLGIRAENLWSLAGSYLVWGYFIGRYQVQFRSLRQITEDPKDFPTQIMAAGIIARVGTLFSGVFYAYVFNETTSHFFVAFLAVVILTCLFFSNIELVKNYAKFLKNLND